MAANTLKIDVKTPDGKVEGSIELPAELFDAPANIALMHQVVTAQRAAARQGTHSTKTRGDVSGGGRKPYRQKGTGRARQGSTRAPQFTGGGVVHGPKPRDYTQRTPKKMIAAALRGALSDRARNGRIHAVTELVSGQTPSTKNAKAFLGTLTDRKQVLVVIGRSDETGAKSVRNLPGVHILAPDQLNTYDVLRADDVVFSVEALNSYIAANTPASGANAAANTASPVVRADDAHYYCVTNWVWFSATAPTRPWQVATAIPDAIYAIPVSSPLYYVTYVRIYSVTADAVVVGYTPGYQGV